MSQFFAVTNQCLSLPCQWGLSTFQSRQTCTLQLHAAHIIDASRILHIGVVNFCLQGITCSVPSSCKFNPHVTPLQSKQSTMDPAARPDAVVSDQQVHVEVSIGNRRMLETQNLHVPRYVAIQQCIAKPAIICLQWQYPFLFNPLFGNPVCHDHPTSQVAR